jgi:hypothetical protein
VWHISRGENVGDWKGSTEYNRKTDKEILSNLVSSKITEFCKNRIKLLTHTHRSCCSRLPQFVKSLRRRRTKVVEKALPPRGLTIAGVQASTSLISVPSTSILYIKTFVQWQCHCRPIQYRSMMKYCSFLFLQIFYREILCQTYIFNKIRSTK